MVFKTWEMDMSLNYLPSIDNSKILSFQDAKNWNNVPKKVTSDENNINIGT